MPEAVTNAAKVPIINTSEYAKVFLINDASDYSVGLAKTVDITLAGRLVGKDTTPTGTTDFTATIAKIKKAKANAAKVPIINTSECAKLIRRNTPYTKV